MPETSVVTKVAEEAIKELTGTDVLVGILTCNNAETIGPLLKAALSGMRQFPAPKWVIVQADGGSTDRTIERAREAAGDGMKLVQVSYPVYPVHKLVASAPAVPGRDSAYRMLFSMAGALGAKACCIVDAGATTITPNWIGSLLRPILEGDFDLVAPQYLRPKYDGLLVNGVVYPLVRALFGKQVRQPIGSDFGFSGLLIRRCLASSAWNAEGVRQSVDLWTTLEAITGGLNVCQAFLGPRPQVRKELAPDLSAVLTETLGALFTQVEHRAEQWQRVRGSEPAPSFGLRFDIEEDPPPVDIKPMVDTFRLGLSNLQEIWSLILPPATLLDLKRMSRQNAEEFRFADELWARTIYDFAVGCRLRTIGRDHLLRALIPLYAGWAASFILSIRNSSRNDVDGRVETLCKSYESQKPYLISRWRWPDRFMP